MRFPQQRQQTESPSYHPASRPPLGSATKERACISAEAEDCLQTGFSVTAEMHACSLRRGVECVAAAARMHSNASWSHHLDLARLSPQRLSHPRPRLFAAPLLPLPALLSNPPPKKMSAPLTHTDHQDRHGARVGLQA